jgi:hypothetical protein
MRVPTLASYNKKSPVCVFAGIKGLAKLAKIFGMPLIVSAIPGEDGKPATIGPELEAGYGPYEIHHRTIANSLLHDDIAALLRRSGKRTILMSGA